MSIESQTQLAWIPTSAHRVNAKIPGSCKSAGFFLHQLFGIVTLMFTYISLPTWMSFVGRGGPVPTRAVFSWVFHTSKPKHLAALSRMNFLTTWMSVYECGQFIN